MKKLRLEIEPIYDFRLIGISCHEESHRLCWALNRISGFDFIREEDIALGDEEEIVFPFFQFELPEENKVYQLLSNRLGNAYILTELNTVEYLFLVRGDVTNDDIQEILDQIHQIDFVILASEIDIFKLKEKDKLLFY